MTEDLSRRVAVVTGGSGPVGSAVARALARRGAAVELSVRRPTEGLSAQMEAEGIQVFGGDLGDEEERPVALQGVIERNGRVDILINTIHVGVPEAAFVADLADVVLQDQLRAVGIQAALCQWAIPHMRAQRWGRIIYVSGALMGRPMPGFASFGAAKAAASVLTRYVALEEGRHGITANIIAPGRVADGHGSGSPDPAPRLTAELLARTAVGAFPSSQQIGEIAGMLSTDLASTITGQTIWLTGGEPVA